MQPKVFLAIGALAFSAFSACSTAPAPQTPASSDPAVGASGADPQVTGTSMSAAGGDASRTGSGPSMPSGARAAGAKPASPDPGPAQGAPAMAPAAPDPGPAPAAAAAGPSRPDADNTRVNARDKGGQGLTPMDQGGSESDRKMTQQIRQAVVGDSSLSFTAKNVKIITIGGKVTLRGAVKSDQERASIEAAAKKVAGDGQVDNQIEVKK